MTVEEKRGKVYEYCGKTKCKHCVLKGKGWQHEDIGRDKCLLIAVANESELDLALSILGGTTATYHSEVEHTAEDAETVIKIKSSRKIDRLIIEFAEEE